MVDLAKPDPGDAPGELLEHFFRHETGRLHGTLLGLFGPGNFALAEDVAQEAMLRATRAWAMGGVPPNPAAWITRVAINLGRDALRRQRMSASKEAAIQTYLDQTRSPGNPSDGDPEALGDETLRLLFACCHPQIPGDAQVLLALKTLCGFTVPEIANAFLATPAAIEKQLARAKQRIRDAGLGFAIPSGPQLEPRLDGVLATLYLLFNEGYKASVGAHLLREELCREAIRLTALLLLHPACDQPRVHALLALMLLNAARFPARQTKDGSLLRLDEQDRSKWNSEYIARGLDHLAQAAQGTSLSEYHLQAGISALHCAAPDAASTDWASILRHYDALYKLKPSPLVALNRAVAVSRVHGPSAGIDSINAIVDREKLESHYLLHAALGELSGQVGDSRTAAASFRQALALAPIGPEREHLARLLEQAGNPSSKPRND